jgi:uncharacterized protein YaaR (DUF327 family)
MKLDVKKYNNNFGNLMEKLKNLNSIICHKNKKYIFLSTYANIYSYKNIINNYI